MACSEGGTLKAKLSGIFSSCLSLEVAILGKSGPTHQSVLRSPRANNNPGGITGCLSVNMLPKDPSGTQLLLIPSRD